ncbi:hypothetical protein [Micromonospora sp. NPDC049799]|uniref:hypothetical protein n=1 Tax=Micromonospora sp. NPDC049799 TaxID=3154741 RepID=UPI0033E1D749
MQEQPPSEPTRREPAAGGRRRSPKATFTPPPAPPEPAGEPDTGTRPTRRAKPAPVVLFQPPEVDEVLPRQKARPVPPESPAPAAEPEAPAAARGTADVAGDLPHTPAATPAEPPEAAVPEEATGAATTTRTGAKRAAAPKKAAPGKRATPTRQAAPAKKTSPVVSAPNTTEDGTTSGEDTSPTGPAPASGTGTRPRKGAARAKTAALTKATPASGPAAPAEPRTARTAAARASAIESPDVEPASGRTPGSELGRVGRKVLDHPGFAPELLALAAVEAVGPRAREWAARLRSAYPDAGDDGLARLATRRFVRQAGAGGAVAAVAGLLAPAAELAAVLWTQANLVLHVAAAYGRDPGHPDRAVELLVLTQVHPDALSARAALAAARDLDAPGAEPWARVAEAAWRLATPLAAQAGGWLALRVASRLLPGAAVLVAATGDAAAAERLAARAVTAYRPTRTR